MHPRVLNFSTATLQDVPEIVARILALRDLQKVSKVQATKTQSMILRTVPPEVLDAIAYQISLVPPTGIEVLSGTVGGE
jgi:hypothetical protein